MASTRVEYAPHVSACARVVASAVKQPRSALISLAAFPTANGPRDPKSNLSVLVGHPNGYLGSFYSCHLANHRWIEPFFV
ncbi:hypothetical protein CRG98_035597 [Punica granatum]|uniref:Uncharacterized protein n=1 Tax=Punica granatum TaxID=22663 RepID=A0A2I0IJ57_PUNGR|nr:hypothetical protein CRG98_035597 [Punica granatum]